MALLSTVVTRRTAFHREVISAGALFHSSPHILPMLKQAGISLPQFKANAFMFLQLASNVRAFDDAFVVAAALSLLGLVPALMLSARPPQRKVRG